MRFLPFLLAPILGMTTLAEAASTQIVFDELSMWHSPANSGIAYESFEPLRVRREGAEYLFRADARRAYSGSHYGEIRLLGEKGGILYLPRDVDLQHATALQVHVRKSNPKSQLAITVFRSAVAEAVLAEGSPALRTKGEGEWSEVTIPLAGLKFAEVRRNLPESPFYREPDLFLSWYKGVPGRLWGIRFGLTNARKGDKLLVDRLVVVRDLAPSARTLVGRLEPPVGGARVVVTTDKGIVTAEVEGGGAFAIGLPPGASKAEIVAETSKLVFSPVQGRFMELGEYLPPVLIKTSEAGIARPVKAGNMNASRYFYGGRRGSRIEPLLNFGVGVEEDNRQLVLAELATNALGYVDRDHAVDGSPGAYRVLWLGECHQMGVHIAQADNWWNEAEGLLAVTTPRPVEIISASFHYSPFVNAWPAFLALSKQYHPDLVVLPLIDPEVLNLNIDEYVMEWLSATKGHLPTYQFSAGPNGKAIHRPYDTDWEVYREQMSEQKRKEIRKKYYSWEYVREDRATTPKWARENLTAVEAALGEFARESRRLGTRVVVLYISGFHFKDNRNEDGVRYVPKPFLEDMRAMTTRAGLEFVDLSESIHRAMPGDDSDRIYFRGNGHWTPYGHFRAGRALAGYLATQASQPKRRPSVGVSSR